MRDERLIVLLDAYLDGSLTPEEKSELERMLLESDAARREFWDRASLHGWTYAAAKLNYSAKPAAEVAKERRELRGESFRFLAVWLKGAWQFGWKAGLLTAGCAAAVLLWLGIRAAVQPPMDEDAVADTTPEPVSNSKSIATLTRGSGVVWENQSGNVEIGSPLSAGPLRLKSGAVQIQFYDGARVIVEGPASIDLVSSGEARLTSGRLSAHVPEPAHGFKVSTPDVSVTDLGTEFGLDREEGKPVQVEVFEGKVEVATDATSQPQILTAGQGVEVSGHQVQTMTAVDRLAFLSAEELARREAAELRSRYADWRRIDRSLDSDPAALVHLNFEDHRNLDRNLINRASGNLNGESAMVFGCDWVEGRWPGKGALEFNSLDDRVRFAVPGQYDSITYLAWVRVDSLPNEWNALALEDTFKTGETHWQIHHNGSMELSVRQEGGKPTWDRVISQPVITRDHFGQWVQLAAVYDGPHKTMSLYVNGAQVASKTFKQKHIITLGPLELGNWTPLPSTAKKSADYLIRELHGRMDEFVLLSRPMSAGEIRHQYEAGERRETMMASSQK
jgi:hypothetical protein